MCRNPNDCVKFSSFAGIKKAAPHGYIQFDEIQKCMDLLYIQAGLLDELSQYAETILREMSLEPSRFALCEESAQEYMKVNFMDFEAGIEDIYIRFDACFRDEEYTLEVNATCNNHETIEIDAIMFRKTSKGSEVYDTCTKSWCECPE